MALVNSDHLQRSAQFDATGQYRYRLDRRWNAESGAIAFIMLNPSRADHRRDDPTVRRCIGLAQSWQYGSLVVVNLFGYCSSTPKALSTVADPIGSNNDDALLQACQSVDQIVLAWGNGGHLYDRDRQILALLHPYRDRLACLGLTRLGRPRHPLYVPRQTQPQPWQFLTSETSGTVAQRDGST